MCAASIFGVLHTLGMLIISAKLIHSDIKHRLLKNKDIASAYLLTVSYLAVVTLASLTSKQPCRFHAESLYAAFLTLVLSFAVGVAAGFTLKQNIGFGDIKLLPLLAALTVLELSVNALFYFAVITAIALLITAFLQRIILACSSDKSCIVKTNLIIPAGPALLAGYWVLKIFALS